MNLFKYVLLSNKEVSDYKITLYIGKPKTKTVVSRDDLSSYMVYIYKLFLACKKMK